MGNLVEIKNFLAPKSKYDDQKYEFVFALDVSGSMCGRNIELAKRALALFIRSLPCSCIFNVVTFESSFKAFFRSSVPYTEKTVSEALDRSKDLRGGGGTELLPPLEFLKNSPQVDGFLTQIFVLTDGDVFHPKKVMELVEGNKTRWRIFSLGIGASASRHLVNGMAISGGGTSVFVDDDEKIERKILKQLKVALQPSLLKAVPLRNTNLS